MEIEEEIEICVAMQPHSIRKVRMNIMGTKVIVVISYDGAAQGEWDACIKVPAGRTADEVYCAWVRKTNRFGWKDETDKYILNETTDAFREGNLDDSLLF